MATLNLQFNALAFSDSISSNQPQRQNFNWTRQNNLVAVNNPRSNEFVIGGGGTTTVFNGIETTSIDGTTAFTVTLSVLNSSVYRFTNSAGTAPDFRTARGITIANQPVTFTRNIDQSATLSVGGSGNFTGAQVGDTIFLPDTLTGDTASVFNALNTGYWIVNGVLSSTALSLVRPTSVVFSATTETKTPTLAASLQIYSAAGIQIGDSVVISAGFAASTQRTYQVTQINPSWFEVISTLPIALESGILPTATGMVFYTSSKVWIRVESDQQTVVQINGDTNTYNRIQPFQAGDDTFPGWWELWGPVYKLVLINKGTTPAGITVLSVE